MEPSRWAHVQAVFHEALEHSSESARRAYLERACDGDVSRFRELKVRFADVVFPGEALTVSAWKQDGRLVIQASTPRAVVLSNAYAVVE